MKKSNRLIDALIDAVQDFDRYFGCSNGKIDPEKMRNFKLAKRNLKNYIKELKNKHVENEKVNIQVSEFFGHKCRYCVSGRFYFGEVFTKIENSGIEEQYFGFDIPNRFPIKVKEILNNVKEDPLTYSFNICD